MKIESIDSSDVKIVTPRIFKDQRGTFFEAWNERAFAPLGVHVRFVQDNQSESKKGVLRGLHYQIEQTQGKLVRVTQGSAFIVAVDLRRDSTQFGQAIQVELDDLQHQSLWVPAGFAHGFLALSEYTRFLYKCTDFYAPQHERVLLWNDETVQIPWPIHRVDKIVVSDQDAMGKSFLDAETFG